MTEDIVSGGLGGIYIDFANRGDMPVQINAIGIFGMTVGDVGLRTSICIAKSAIDHIIVAGSFVVIPGVCQRQETRRSTHAGYFVLNVIVVI